MWTLHSRAHWSPRNNIWHWHACHRTWKEFLCDPHFPRFTVITASFVFPIFLKPVKLCTSPLTWPSQPWCTLSSSVCRKALLFLYHTCSFSSRDDKNREKEDFAVMPSWGIGTYRATFITVGTLIIHTANVTGDSMESHMTYFMWEMFPDEIYPGCLDQICPSS